MNYKEQKNAKNGRGVVLARRLVFISLLLFTSISPCPQLRVAHKKRMMNDRNASLWSSMPCNLYFLPSVCKLCTLYRTVSILF